MVLRTVAVALVAAAVLNIACVDCFKPIPSTLDEDVDWKHFDGHSYVVREVLSIFLTNWLAVEGLACGGAEPCGLRLRKFNVSVTLSLYGWSNAGSGFV